MDVVVVYSDFYGPAAATPPPLLLALGMTTRGPKNSQSGFKFLTTMHRLHIEKFLTTGIIALLVWRGLCQSEPSQTPARAAPRAELASSDDLKHIAEHGQRALAEGQYVAAEHDFQQLLKLGVH